MSGWKGSKLTPLIVFNAVFALKTSHHTAVFFYDLSSLVPPFEISFSFLIFYPLLWDPYTGLGFCGEDFSGGGAFEEGEEEEEENASAGEKNHGLRVGEGGEFLFEQIQEYAEKAHAQRDGGGGKGVVEAEDAAVEGVGGGELDDGVEVDDDDADGCADEVDCGKGGQEARKYSKTDKA